MVCCASLVLLGGGLAAQTSKSEGSEKYRAEALSAFIDGLIADLSQNYADAIASYREALERDGSAPSIALALANDYYLVGRIDKARKLVDGVLSGHPDHIEALELLADLLFHENEYLDMVSTLERVVRLEPANVDARYKLISIYEIQGKSGDAATHYAALLRWLGPNSLISLKLGDYYLRNKSYEKAVSVLKNARDAEPNNVYVIEALGQAYALNKDYTRALDAYEDLARLQEQNHVLWVRIGNLALQTEQYDKAVDAFERASLPNNAEIQRSLGFAYRQLGRPDPAVRCLEQAIALNPKDVLSMNLLAPIYQDLHYFDKSDSVFERILELEPDNDLVLNNYSYSLAVRSTRLDRAMEMIKKALARAPNNSHYLDTMGWVYYQLGDYEQALRYVKQSYALDPTSWEVTDHLGDIHARLKDLQTARSFWKKALELKPDQTSIQSKLPSTP